MPKTGVLATLNSSQDNLQFREMLQQQQWNDYASSQVTSPRLLGAGNIPHIQTVGNIAPTRTGRGGLELNGEAPHHKRQSHRQLQFEMNRHKKELNSQLGRGVPPPRVAFGHEVKIVNGAGDETDQGLVYQNGTRSGPARGLGQG